MRKIFLDKIHIPLYASHPNDILIEFIKKLWKFRCVLFNLCEKFKNVNIDVGNLQCDDTFSTYPTPIKKKIIIIKNNFY